MASTTLPARRTEEAFFRYVQAAAGAELAGLTVHKRADDDELGPNRLSIICRVARRAAPDCEPSAGFVCEVLFKITTHAGDTTGDRHDEYAGAVFDALMTSDMINQLNAAMAGEPFTATDGGWYPPDEITFDVQGHRQTSEMVGRLHMTPLPQD